MGSEMCIRDRFRFAGHLGWQELAYLGGAVGIGGEFSPFIRAFRGARGGYSPRLEVVGFAGGLLSNTSKEVKRPFLSGIEGLPLG